MNYPDVGGLVDNPSQCSVCSVCFVANELSGLTLAHGGGFFPSHSPSTQLRIEESGRAFVRCRAFCVCLFPGYGLLAPGYLS